MEEKKMTQAEGRPRDSANNQRPSRPASQATQIEFAVGSSWLGSVLMACSERGVCAISLGDDVQALVRDLQRQFPDASLIESSASREQELRALLHMIERPHARYRLVLDTGGTPFQRRVWAALQAIPLGHSATYSGIARAIGAPRAVRAVASACAANKIAVVIPCHRVLRADGGLSGYRWGVAKKQALLEREAAWNK